MIVVSIVAVVAVVTVFFIVAMAVFRPETALEVREDRTEKIEGITAVRQDVVPTINTQALVLFVMADNLRFVRSSFNPEIPIKFTVLG